MLVWVVPALAAAAGVSAQPPSQSGSPRTPAPPALRREPPALGSTIPAEALVDLPASANLLSLLDGAQADAISDRLDTGGVSAAEAARIGAHGSSWTQTHFRLGSANLTAPGGTGIPLLIPNLHAWDRVEVATGLIPVEINAAGLAITLEPRRPGASWTRSLDGVFTRPGLLARTIVTTPPAITRVDSWTNVNLLVAGPLVPGRVGLVLTPSWTRSTHFERDNPTRLDASLTSVFTHLELTPSSSDLVRIVGWGQRGRLPFANRNAFGQPSAAEHELGGHVQTAWSHVNAKDVAFTLFGSYTGRNRSPQIAAASAIMIERLRDGPVQALSNPTNGTDRMWSAGVKLVPPPARLFGRSFTLRSGGEVSGAAVRSGAPFTGLVGELVDGLPARVWSYAASGSDSRWRRMAIAAYAAERIELHPRLLLDAGIRFESISGSAGAAGNDSDNSVHWNNWLPRASLRWEITHWAGLAGFAGFGRYGYELPLQYFAYGDANAQLGSVFRWRVATATQPPRASEIGELIARVGPGTGGDPRFTAIDPKLRRPFMDEFVTGFESRPSRGSVIRLAALARREKQLVGLLNIGVPLSSYTIVGIPDPGLDLFSAADDHELAAFNRSRASFGADRYLLTNPAGDHATYVGVDLTGQTNIERLFLLAGATAGRSEGLSGNRGFQAIENDHGVIGELFTDPNATASAKGRLFTERGYTIKIAAAYRIGYDVRVGAVARYQDGQHFARLVIAQNLNQGPEAIRAFQNGLTRFTYSLTVDTRLQKSFALGTRRVDAIVDAYNLLNTAKEVEEFPVTGPTSRLTAAVQPPRAIHLGLRIAF